MLAVEKQQINDAGNRTAGHTDIREIEDREINEAEIQKIHHVTADRAVDQVADTAGNDQHTSGRDQCMTR